MRKGLMYVLFAREPVVGRVKSRLSSGIGPEAAARIYEAILKDTLSCLREAGEPFAVAYTPESDPGYFSALVGEAVRLLPQRGAYLGERMNNAFEQFRSEGYGGVLIVGSDNPFLTPEILHEASGALESNQVVIGPSRDGGYYLIGLTQPTPELFRGIEWGSENVSQQTIEIIQRIGYCCHWLPELSDIDDIKDLANLARELELRKVKRLVLPTNTLREIERLQAGEDKETGRRP